MFVVASMYRIEQSLSSFILVGSSSRFQPLLITTNYPDKERPNAIETLW